MPPPDSLLETWVCEAREQYEVIERTIEEVGPRGSIYRSLAREAGVLGLVGLVREDVDARTWLERALDHQERALEIAIDAAEDDPAAALVPWTWSLACDAYLLGDERLGSALDRVAGAPPRYPKLYPEHVVRYYRILAFRALLNGEEEAVRRHLDSFRLHAEIHDEDDAFADCVEGFLDDDPDRIAAGIEGLCVYHYEWIEDDLDDRGHGEGIALNALVMATLAAERGYDIEVEHEGLLDPPPWKPPGDTHQ